jgi:hypothetical protein
MIHKWRDGTLHTTPDLSPEPERLECVGGPMDGERIESGRYVLDGRYFRRPYRELYRAHCERDPLAKLLPDVWQWVPDA